MEENDCVYLTDTAPSHPGCPPCALGVPWNRLQAPLWPCLVKVVWKMVGWVGSLP